MAKQAETTLKNPKAPSLRKEPMLGQLQDYAKKAQSYAPGAKVGTSVPTQTGREAANGQMRAKEKAALAAYTAAKTGMEKSSFRQPTLVDRNPGSAQRENLPDKNPGKSKKTLLKGKIGNG